MAILEKSVLINLVPGVISYYEELGYKIQRCVDSRGKLTVKRGTKIEVKIEHLRKRSNIKVTKICDICGQLIPNQYYQNIIIQRENGDGLDRCFSCSKVKGVETRWNNIPFENSFAFKFPQLINEWNFSRNNKSPYEVSYASNKIYWWTCNKCGSDYDMKINKRTMRNANCPYCAGMRVNHTNCLWSTHPDVAKQLANSNDGYNHTAGSEKKVNFKCLSCESIIKNKQISVVVKGNGCYCTRCSEGVSYPEKFMFNILLQNNIIFETQKSFNWSQNKRYDFYIPSLNCIIETHGGQHFARGFEQYGGRSLEEEQQNDKLKEKMAKDNNIKHYIVINCSKSEMDFIRNNVLNSKLKQILELNSIDWLNCHEYSCNSLVNLVCEIWNEKKSIIEICRMLKLERHTVGRYLTQGSAIGLCNFAKKKFFKPIKMPIVRCDLNGVKIDEYDSAKSAERILNITQANISAVCSGKRKTAGGYKWIYKDDYELFMNTQK